MANRGSQYEELLDSVDSMLSEPVDSGTYDDLRLLVAELPDIPLSEALIAIVEDLEASDETNPDLIYTMIQAEIESHLKMRREYSLQESLSLVKLSKALQESYAMSSIVLEDEGQVDVILVDSRSEAYEEGPESGSRSVLVTRIEKVCMPDFVEAQNGGLFLPYQYIYEELVDGELEYAQLISEDRIHMDYPWARGLIT